VCAFYPERPPTPAPVSASPASTPHKQRIPVYTTSDAPAGYRIERTLGLCSGIAIRSRDVMSQTLAGLRILAGGEITEFVQLAEVKRAEALERLEASAVSMGANAVVGVRFDSTTIQPANEIFAYGTAVVVVPVTD